MKKTDVLVYTGGATSRTVTKDGWMAAGVTDQDTVVWAARNSKRCKVGDLSEAAMELLMELHENEFRVIPVAEAKANDEHLAETSRAAKSAPNGN